MHVFYILFIKLKRMLIKIKFNAKIVAGAITPFGIFGMVKDICGVFGVKNFI